MALLSAAGGRRLKPRAGMRPPGRRSAALLAVEGVGGRVRAAPSRSRRGKRRSTEEEPGQHDDGIAQLQRAAVVRVGGVLALERPPSLEEMEDDADRVRQIHLTVAIHISATEPRLLATAERAIRTDRMRRLISHGYVEAVVQVQVEEGEGEGTPAV